MVNRINKEELLSKIRKQVEKVCQTPQKVDIRFDKLPNGKYKTKIEVIAPNNFYVASKTDSSFGKCIEKTRDAILNQIKKTKMKSQRSHADKAGRIYYDLIQV